MACSSDWKMISVAEEKIGLATIQDFWWWWEEGKAKLGCRHFFFLFFDNMEAKLRGRGAVVEVSVVIYRDFSMEDATPKMLN